MAFDLAGGGVDHVVEVGGAGTFEQSIEAVKTRGRISVIGVLSGVEQPMSIRPFIVKQISVQGIFVGHREMFQRMLSAVAINEIKPVIDQVFDFDDAPKALEHMAEGKHFGKIVIRIGG